MVEMVSTSDVDDRIRTEFVEANYLRFEVDMCGDGDKLALCLHGFPEHSISWRYQLPMLAELGYKAWAPNMRGYGNSSVPMFLEDYSPENLMADVAGLIDAAGCDEVVLIAHDWGAVIAWYFAIRQMRPLNKLIICNVPHPVPAQRAISNGFAQLKKSWYIFYFQIPGLPEMMTRMRGEGAMGDLIKKSSSNPANYPDEVIDVYNQNSSRPENLTAMVNYYRALVRGGGGKRQKDLGYPMIETPTLMLWGEDDLALTKETTYGTEDVVKDFTIRYLPRISHWVQQDAPEEVNAMMSAFLTGQPVPEMTWEPKLLLPEVS
ncbi:MAG: epoxide hydrolase [Gammaproteobacteria bacterium]|nr:epoxide hydrolase [Gammaproteobacteria bacterium]